MRIQFFPVPTNNGVFSTREDKILMCVSEVQNKSEPAKLMEQFENVRTRVGAAAVLVTDEVVHFGPPERDVEPLLPGRLWDAAVVDEPVVRWFCPMANVAVEYTNITPHGPCLYVSCAREHCRCEHSDPFKPETEPEGEAEAKAVSHCEFCVARVGVGWVLTDECDHA